jgi:peptide/nickel transport system ATP-binding protein
MRADQPDEPLWKGVERLKAENGRVRLDFHLPHEPQLAAEGDVEVACHLYNPPV